MMEKKLLTSPIRQDRKPLQDLIPLAQPLRVFIDPCDICNFKCKFCFQTYDINFKGRVMSDEIFDKIISQLKEFDNPINVVHLYGLGEPLLNNNIVKYIKLLRDNGVAKEIACTSNGSRLNKELSE